MPLSAPARAANWQLRTTLYSMLIGAMALGGHALAVSTGNSYVLVAQAIGAGGGAQGSGAIALEGTIGQQDAGSAQSGGPYTLTGGFRHPGAASENNLFSNGFE